MTNGNVSFVCIDADDFDPDAGFAKKEGEWEDEDRDLKQAVGVAKWAQSVTLYDYPYAP